MIDFSKVIDIDIKKKILFYSSDGHLIDGRPFHIFTYENSEFQEVLFLYKKWLKNRKDPLDRVALFEYYDKGSDLDKFIRLFNSRLKSHEKDMYEIKD